MLLSAIFIFGLMALMFWNKPVWPAAATWVLMPLAVAATIWWFDVLSGFEADNLVNVLWAATAMLVAFFGAIAFAAYQATGERPEQTRSLLTFLFDPTGLNEKRRQKEPVVVKEREFDKAA
ncbi:MAG: hypothetical protein AAGE89_06065 [Pseudomonadota bacterium]